MWTAKNRGRYDRSALRYPSDLTDDAIVHPADIQDRDGGIRFLPLCSGCIRS